MINCMYTYIIIICTQAYAYTYAYAYMEPALLTNLQLTTFVSCTCTFDFSCTYILYDSFLNVKLIYCDIVMYMAMDQPMHNQTSNETSPKASAKGGDDHGNHNI